MTEYKREIHRIYTFGMLLLLCIIVGNAANIEHAHQAYSKGLYQQAISIYEEDIKQNGNNTEALLGIANSYYRMQDPIKAILYYERILHIDPSQEIVWHNNELVRSKEGIEPYPEGYFYETYIRLIGKLSSNTWSIIGIVFFSFACSSLVYYLRRRRISHWGLIAESVIFSVFIICVINSWMLYRFQKGVAKGLIVIESAKLYNSSGSDSLRIGDIVKIYETMPQTNRFKIITESGTSGSVDTAMVSRIN